MLQLAAEADTTDIVATPHANTEYRYDPEIIEAKLLELRGANPTPVRIHRGCDFHLDYDLVEDALANPRKYTVNQKNYLLIELPDTFLTRTVPPILDNLMRRGMTPILTHPERYYGLRGKLDDLRDWVAMGCLVQVTGQSLLGFFGSTARKISEQLLSDRIVHFIASDAHEATGRTPRLSEARTAVVNRYGEDRAKLLFELNPQAVIDGAPLPKPERKSSSRRSSGWFSFLRKS